MKFNFEKIFFKRNSYKKLKSVYVLILLVFTFSFLFNSNRILFNILGKSQIKSISSSGLDCLDNTNSLDITISIPEITIDNIIDSEGSKFQKIGFKDCGYIGEIGKPKMPVKSVTLLLSHGTDLVDIEINTGEKIVVEGSYVIEPSQEQIPIDSGKEQNFAFDRQFYSSGNVFPEKLYEIVDIYEFRGYRILVLNLFPANYIPKTGLLSYYEEFNVKVNLCEKTGINSLFRGLSSDRDQVMNLIDNPEVLDSYANHKVGEIKSQFSFDIPSGTYDYLIITNDALYNSDGDYTFQDLALSKEGAGYETIIVTTEEIYTNYTGVDNQEKIRNFIIDAYNEWGIEYVLLGGDGDGGNVGGESGDSIIPARGFYAEAYGDVDSNIPSDLYYAALDGTWNNDGDGYWGEPGEEDLYAEVFVGRAPVDSETELSNFVYKTLAHENDAHSYLSKALMVGENLGWYSTGADYKDEILYGSDAQEYTTVGFPEIYNVSTLYDRDYSPYSWDKYDLIPLINDGVHIINHLGHSDVDYALKMYNEDVDLLTNEHFFFGYSQGCYNGAFDNRGPYEDIYSYDCITEHFVTETHGAFAFIGNSRYGWGDPYGTDGSSQYYDREFFDAIFGENILEIGKANQDSKHDNVGRINQDAMRWVYYELNLFGDPMAMIPGQINDYAPTLTDASVSTMIGDQMTPLNFSVVYTDTDSNPPIYMNLILNGTSYEMEKQDYIDSDYTDGCVYQYLIYLQPGTYEFSFECNDYKFEISTPIISGLLINQAPNTDAPSLFDGIVNPDRGFAEITEFTFSVNYTDANNNHPHNISVIINSIEFPLAKADSLDTNYMDGCIYVHKTMLNNYIGNNYHFNCSDGVFINTTETYFGPEVIPMRNYQMFTNNPYNWIEASGGTELSLGDDSYVTIALPFDFPFYDKIFSKIYLSANGYLSFKDPTPNEYENVAFPSDDNSHIYLLAPFWTDLNPFRGGSVYYQSFGDFWVAQWTNIYHYWGDLVGSFQIVINKSGEIIFNYDYISHTSDGYTCGLNYGLDTYYYNLYEGLTDNTDDFSISFKWIETDHDLRVRLTIPELPEIANNYIITAKMQNIGKLNEENVNLYLYYENTIVNSSLNIKLDIGETKIIIFQWIPTDYGKYNFTIYAMPVTNETYILNNLQTKIANVIDVNLFNGLFLNYDFEIDGAYGVSEFYYTEVSAGIFNIEWEFMYGGYSYMTYWDVDVRTRVMSNSVGALSFGNDVCTPMWIFTDTSIGDTISIAVDGEGEHIFEVSSVDFYELQDFGVIEIFELQDLTTPGGYALYETTTGLLVEGNFLYYDGLSSYSFELTETNGNITKLLFDHDLEVDLNMPEFPEIGTTYEIVAELHNNGLYEEININFILYLNGIIINYNLIPNLPIGATESITYQWTPEKKNVDYNFTVYTPPLSTEIYISNNIEIEIRNIVDIKLFNGLYLDYSFNMEDLIIPMMVYYTEISKYIYNGTLSLSYDSQEDSETWQVNSQTRIMTGLTSFGTNVHTPWWIFTNVAIGDEIPIAVIMEGDHIFQVTDIYIFDSSTFGNIEVIKVQDLTTPGGYALYEKNTGLLIEGKFFFYDGLISYLFKLTDTNADFNPGGRFVPGYEINIILLIIGTSLLGICYRISKKHRKLI